MNHEDHHESLSLAHWESTDAPERVLIIRMHAIGDVAITLPACTALRDRFPDAEIDFLTTASIAPLVGALDIFNTILEFPHCTSRIHRAVKTTEWSFALRKRRYDIVLDLQRNWVSRTLRVASSPRSWAEFDRFALRAAGLRVLDTFHRIGFTDLTPSYHMSLRRPSRDVAELLLESNGWNRTHRLVVLNPAGLWETRNWPLKNYVDLARLWLEHDQVQFLLLGTQRVLQKAEHIEQQVQNSTINLVNKTSLGEALAIMQHVALMVSEDSGLMHMAWVSGVPTIALFGSSRHQWSTPLGEHSVCLHSADLPCGACMSPTCKFNDVHCLTRHSPHEVFEIAQTLLVLQNSNGLSE